MKKANSDNKERIVDILSKSFDANRSVNYVVRQGRNREARIRRLMEYSFEVCHRFGKVWISDDKLGCALVLMPEKKRTSFHTIAWDLRLALSAIGLTRVTAVMKRESRVKTFHPKVPYCYLWFIGVDPKHQSRGIGSRLMKEIIARCEHAGRPIYLETSVEANLSWYKKFGFEIFHTLDFGYTLYFLKREQR